MFNDIRFLYHKTIVEVLSKLFIRGETDISKMNNFQKSIVYIMRKHFKICADIYVEESK